MLALMHAGETAARARAVQVVAQRANHTRHLLKDPAAKRFMEDMVALDEEIGRTMNADEWFGLEMMTLERFDIWASMGMS
jgi:hypothetical protein